MASRMQPEGEESEVRLAISTQSYLLVHIRHLPAGLARPRQSVRLGPRPTFRAQIRNWFFFL